MDCPSAGDWPAWTRPSGSRTETCWGQSAWWLEPWLPGTRNTQPQHPPAPCRPESPHGQVHTAGPSLQTLGSPRLGGAPSHFLPKDRSSPGISHPQRTQPLSWGFLQPRPESEVGRNPSPGPHPLLGRDGQEGEAKQRPWMSPPTEGMPRGAVSACTSFWCGGQRSETPPTSYGCPPFKTCAPASRAANLLSVGSTLLSTLQWPPGMGSGPGSLKAPLGESSFQRDAGAVMRWGASPGGSWSPAPRGSALGGRSQQQPQA